MKNQHLFGPQRTWPTWLLLLAVAVAVLVASEHQVTSSVEQERRVRAFVAAFNARDIDAMLALADDNIQWLSVNGPKVTIETEGKLALGQSMGRYFKSCPSCKSSLEWVQIAGSRVTAMERATWSSKSGAKSQSGLSVYEFNGDKILRVYYFPAERP
jgi:hypothetical protein